MPYNSYTEYGSFIQDQWRASAKLTFNMGLLGSVHALSEKHNRLSDFLLNSGTFALAGQNGFSGSILGVQKHDFSPRLGLAYRLTDRMVIRAAYGLFYFNEQGIGGWTRLLHGLSVRTHLRRHLYFDRSVSEHVDRNSGDLLVGQSADSRLSADAEPDFELPAVERHHGASGDENAGCARAYVGTKGNHLNLNLDENVAVPGAGAVPGAAALSRICAGFLMGAAGGSMYNALQLSVEKRMSFGLSFLGAYTYGKSLDNGAGGNSSTGESRINIQNPQDLRADYGYSNFDIRQRFTLNTMYRLPFGRGRQFMNHASRALDTVAGGWQLSSIVTLQGGMPFSVSMATTTSNTGTFQRPNRLCDGNFASGQRSIHQWYQLSCFATPAIYTYGNTGRNVLIGPGLET